MECIYIYRINLQTYMTRNVSNETLPRQFFFGGSSESVFHPSLGFFNFLSRVLRGLEALASTRVESNKHLSQHQKYF